MSTIYKLLVLLFFVPLSLLFSQEQGLNIGDKAPEIRLPDPKGDTITLSSFRGKVVLIDFWGSWCAPCVKEQPELAAIYKKYKNSSFNNGNGFEIFGVSLDNKKKSWQAIIKRFNINWVQVSDLLFWTSPVAKDYNIQELPYNVLIDGNGVILSTNLHGIELDESIRKLIKK